VANHIIADEQKGLMAIEEDNDDVDTNDEDKDGTVIPTMSRGVNKVV
jgi:hypothetical protein